MARRSAIDKARDDLLEHKRLDKESWDLLALIIAEWKSDPMSVQHFDLAVIERAKLAIKQKNKLANYGGLGYAQTF